MLRSGRDRGGRAVDSTEGLAATFGLLLGRCGVQKQISVDRATHSDSGGGMRDRKSRRRVGNRQRSRCWVSVRVNQRGRECCDLRLRTRRMVIQGLLCIDYSQFFTPLECLHSIFSCTFTTKRSFEYAADPTPTPSYSSHPPAVLAGFVHHASKKASLAQCPSFHATSSSQALVYPQARSLP